ncbi:uncharacterized protein TNCV_133651 [Trichonephila clavipes]|nr:uncharacterized protein TNCV_133651 [Trichonephila clavipes]
MTRSNIPHFSPIRILKLVDDEEEFQEEPEDVLEEVLEEEGGLDSDYGGEYFQTLPEWDEVEQVEEVELEEGGWILPERDEEEQEVEVEQEEEVELEEEEGGLDSDYEGEYFQILPERDEEQQEVDNNGGLDSDYEGKYFQILPGYENEDEIQHPHPQVEPLNESASTSNSIKLPNEIPDLKQEKQQVDQCEDPGPLRKSSSEDGSEKLFIEYLNPRHKQVDQCEDPGPLRKSSSEDDSEKLFIEYLNPRRKVKIDPDHYVSQHPNPQVEPLNESASTSNSIKLPIEIPDLKQEKQQVDQCEDPGPLRKSSSEDDSEKLFIEYLNPRHKVKIDPDHYDVSQHPHPQVEPLNESATSNSLKLPIEIPDLKQEKQQVDQCEDPGPLRKSSSEDDSEKLFIEYLNPRPKVKIDPDHYDVSEDLNTAPKRIRR